jgi:predicted adenine nucleotide alpha hydrolase (AANH) superfamily ATPase
VKVVLHICCGVCAAAAVERLTSEGHQVLGLFYNPNIYPAREYQRRLDATYKVAQELNFPLEAAPYRPKEWFKETNSLKDEPEGGKRCEVCFRLRLKKTYLYMIDCGWDAFTTTLTISPHKSAELINQIGWEIGGDKFLTRNFKKRDGFKRTMQLAREWDLYRQNYCGCIYSMR